MRLLSKKIDLKPRLAPLKISPRSAMLLKSLNYKLCEMQVDTPPLRGAHVRPHKSHTMGDDAFLR